MSKLVIVTGAGGAVGRSVTDHLVNEGHRVIGLGHGPMRDERAVEWLNGEIDAANLSGLASRWGAPDAIIHLAGGSAVGPSIKAPQEDFARTVATSVRLLDWVRQATPTTPVVLASSAAVYGAAHDAPIDETKPRTPYSPYGSHKAMMEMSAEQYARNFGLKVATVRLFSVYGEHLKKQLIWEVATKLLRGETDLRLGGTGREQRDWLHIRDAARMLTAAIGTASEEAPVYNGCTGTGITVRETVESLARHIGTAPRVSFSGEARAGDPFYLVGAAAAAARAGLEASIPFETGLAETVAWIRRQRA